MCAHIVCPEVLANQLPAYLQVIPLGLHPRVGCVNTRWNQSGETGINRSCQFHYLLELWLSVYISKVVVGSRKLE